MPRKRKVGRPKKKVKRTGKSKGKRKKRKVAKRRSGGQQGSGFFDDVGSFLGNVVGGVKDTGLVGNALLATGNPLLATGAKLLGFGSQKNNTSKKLTKKQKQQLVLMARDPRMIGMKGEGVFGDFLKSTAKQAVQVARDNQLVSKALASRGHGKLSNAARLGGFGSQSGGGYDMKTSVAVSSR